ncbi:putative glycoside hydrolase [Alteromonadaceae bacterium BrNp21-10]|nr:putative glycoside hydrolase [Alteromonadaceae bacterium BrNp21-10]
MFVNSRKNTLAGIMFTCFLLPLAGCSNTTTESNAALLVQQQQLADIPLFSANIAIDQQPHRLSISIPEQSKIISSAFTEVDNKTLNAAIIVDEHTAKSALALSLNDTWRGSLHIDTDEPLNLNAYMTTGSIDLDINVQQFYKTALDIVMDCGPDCESSVRLREWALSAKEQGWQKLSIPLTCFMQDNANFAHVKRPITLQMGGKGQLTIASINIKATGPSNFQCPDKATLTTTPDILNEYWAVDWWMPRHKEKVAIAQQGNIDLLMIGDSITHGWENHGKEVWQKHFGDIQTLNIGFSGDRTENVIWRLQHNTVDGINPKLAVMMIGTNNTGHRFDKPEYIANGVKAIIDDLAVRLPKTPLLLLAIFPRSASADDKLRINNEQTNVLLKALAQQYPQVEFANFNAAFLTEGGTLTKEIMPDLLHPHAEGYEIWANQLEPFIDQYLKK